jgi:hypothetical protein
MMTTEQMDFLDDERAGRHIADKLVPKRPVKDDGRSRWPFTPNLGDKVITEKNGIRAWGMSGIPEIMFGDPSDEQLAAAQERSGRNGVLIIPEAVRDQLFGSEPYWVEAGLKPGTDYHVNVNGGERTVMTTDAEEHTHHTREARDQCAAGDHKYAVLLDDAAEREKLKADEIRKEEWERWHSGAEITTMAEEPIENRLRRAWLNGFKDGVDRASYAATESTGRWDY